MYQEEGAPININPPLSEENMKTPKTAPQIDPIPPRNVQPPITAAAIVSSSNNFPEVEYISHS